MSNFIDYVRLFCASGDGGKGSMHLHREKFVPKGGPDGGNGGRGGHIILRGNTQFWTLIHLKYRKHIKAEAGGAGSGALRSGAEGKDIVLDVPLGTVAKNAETGEILFEITNDGEEKILCKGGRGGMGNAFFKTNYWLMLAWWAFPMPENLLYYPWCLRPNPRLPTMLLLRWNLIWALYRIAMDIPL